MIYIEPEHRLTLTITNNDNTNDIVTFCNIITKCLKESKKPGYHNMFSKSEKDIIKELASNLNLDKESPAEGFTQIGPTSINV